MKGLSALPNNDLGLTQNKKLKHIYSTLTGFGKLPLHSNLPRLETLTLFGDKRVSAENVHWDCLKTFPELQRFAITMLKRPVSLTFSNILSKQTK